MNMDNEQADFQIARSMLEAYVTLILDYKTECHICVVGYLLSHVTVHCILITSSLYKQSPQLPSLQQRLLQVN